MARRYSLSFTDVAVTAAQDLFQIEGNGSSVKLLGCTISQSSDVGDAAEEGLLILVNKGITTAITNSAAERQLVAGDAAANANCNVNQTTQATAAAIVIHAEVWNIRMPWVWLPIPELRPVLSDGEAATIDLTAAPADSLTVSGTLYFEEE